MTALNFPASPSSGDVHNAANGLQYAFDGVKWTSQGTYDSGTINAQKLDSIASQFNGSTTTFNLKVNNNTVKPHNEQSVSIVLAGSLQEPGTAYTTSQTGTITFASAPAGGTAFFGVLLTRLPVTSSTSASPASGSAAGTMSASDFTKLAGIETGATADQTGAEIKSAYEGEADTNAFTDADHTKLDGIATGAEVNVQSNWNQTNNTADDFIQNKPTIPAAYGDSDVDSHLNTSTASSGQILSWTGSDYDWVADATGGGGGSSVGGATGVDFNDNVKIRFGNTAPNSPDLEIYHDGSNSIISDAGTGALLLYGSDIILHKSGSAERLADFAQDGSTGARLYYDAGTYSTAKLATTATGVTVDGTVTADKLTTGTTNNNIQLEPNGTGVVEIRGAGGADGTLQLNCSQNSHGVKIKSPAHSAGASYTLTLPTTDGSNGEFLKTDGSGGLSWGSATTSVTASDINAAFPDDGTLILGTGSGDDTLKLYFGYPTGQNSGEQYGFMTADAGVHIQYDGANRLETHASGTKWIGDLNCDDNQTIKLGSSADLTIKHDTNNSIIDATGNGSLLLYASDIIFHEKSDAAHKIAEFSQDSSTGCKLYYDNSPKFQTTNTGVTISGATASTGDLTITKAQPTIDFVDSGNDPDYRVRNDAGTFFIRDITNSANRFTIDTGKIVSTLNHDFSAGIDVTGNITVTGTVDGIDIATDVAANTAKVTNATHTGEVTGSGALTIADNVVDEANLKVSNSPTNGYVLTAQSGNTGGLTWSAAGAAETASTINALYEDNGNFILGTGTGSDTMKLYYDGTHGFITADNGVRLQYDGSTKFETTSYGALLTGNLKLGDNRKVTFGDGDDLQFFHDGSNSYLKEAGTGNVIHEVTDATIEFKKGGSEHLAKFIPDGSVQLYWDNSLKLETLSSGVKWHGDLFCDDNQFLKVGSSADINIYHDGNSHFRVDNGDTVIRGASTSSNPKWLYIKANADGENSIISKGDGEVELFYNGSLKFETENLGVKVYGHIFADDNKELRLGNSGDLQLWHDGNNSNIYNTTGTLYVRGNRSGFIDQTGAEWGVKYEVNSFAQLFYDNGLKLETQSSGVKWFGDLYCDDSQTLKLGSSADLRLFHDGNNSIIGNQTGVLIIASDNELLLRSNTGGENYFRGVPNGDARLYYDNSKKLATVNAGVEITGSLNPDQHNLRDLGASSQRWATLYVVNQPNVSDRNEKNTIQHSDLGLSFINKLNPVSFKWNDTSLGTQTRYGLIAQEVEEAVKESGKDVDDIGMIDKPKEGSMGLCTNELIAPLVKAIQELSAKVAALEAA